jgi:hypothetical protein
LIGLLSIKRPSARSNDRQIITLVKKPYPEPFCWLDLDADLTAEIIDHPERLPLKAK